MAQAAGKDARLVLEIDGQLRKICKDYAIALDFDGVLFKEKWPAIGEPIIKNITAARTLRKYGCRLILWTCREGEALEQAIEACKSWGLEFDAVNANLPEWIEKYGNDCRKIGANLYIDDRALRVGA